MTVIQIKPHRGPYPCLSNCPLINTCHPGSDRKLDYIFILSWREGFFLLFEFTVSDFCLYNTPRCRESLRSCFCCNHCYLHMNQVNPSGLKNWMSNERRRQPISCLIICTGGISIFLDQILNFHTLYFLSCFLSLLWIIWSQLDVGFFYSVLVCSEKACCPQISFVSLCLIVSSPSAASDLSNKCCSMS